jgi:hypothetical protein
VIPFVGIDLIPAAFQGIMHIMRIYTMNHILAVLLIASRYDNRLESCVTSLLTDITSNIPPISRDQKTGKERIPRAPASSCFECAGPMFDTFTIALN